MVSITKLAKSRLRYHKSRTVLSIIAVMLMTVLLMGLGTSVTALMDMNRQQAEAEGNVHATFSHLDRRQIDILKNHKEVESLEVSEIFASVEYGKINGYLTFTQEPKDGIYHGVGQLLEGREPQYADDLCASESFFQRVGVEPVVGNRFTLSFRPGGEGLIQTREFEICGILSEADITNLDINEEHIVYGARVSEALIDSYFTGDQREYYANLRVYGEEQKNYDEMVATINLVAEDIGCDENHVTCNTNYLYVMTDPGAEMAAIVTFIALLVILFSGLVIYSIYYVSVITDVQEIGKIKALGASSKQVRKMLLTEGFVVSVLALPPGLLVGYLIPRTFLPLIIKKMSSISVSAVPVESLHMFSFAVLLLVIAVTLLTVVLSLLRPMRMASKISPIEAIRYQESRVSTKSRGKRRRRSVTLGRLTAANLMRNKKRTIVTMVVMGLSCVLFLSFAGVLNSAQPEDIARREVPEGDFRLYLDCNWNDKEYPESNLNRIQQHNPMNSAFIEELKALPGVEKTTTDPRVLVSSDFPSELFEEGNRVSLSTFSKDEVSDYEKILEKGTIDYDLMSAENGAIFTSDHFMDEYGFEIGDTVDLMIYDGDDLVPLTIKICGSVDSGYDDYFLIPEEVFQHLGLKTDTTTSLNLFVSASQYDAVKSSLTEIADSNDYFTLYSLDEELKLGKATVNIVKYPMYLVLCMVAIISFMNLINTMITSIMTRKREIGILQSIGLSENQLRKMLDGEGLVFTVGALFAALTVGNLFGYLLFLWAKSSQMLSITQYHYPLWETVAVVVVFLLGQLVCSRLIQWQLRKESLIDRIRSRE